MWLVSPIFTFDSLYSWVQNVRIAEQDQRVAERMEPPSFSSPLVYRTV